MTSVSVSIRDVIDEGVNGWFAPTEDANAFATKIQTLLDDLDALHAASKRSADYVRSTFRWNTTAERYLDVLRSL